MAEPSRFTPIQVAEIRDAFIARRHVACPVCAGRMASDTVASSSIGYDSSRRRIHLVCRDCHRSATFSAPAPTSNASE